ncbi:2TM domain-containing protein [Intrasporangium flavum]|uniref:2TM domain-containing protein n=1 Tax=Intrasporangium flavum TaxID=1428657 RepID=UPI001A96D9CF|nr:2TM domain-containing protein [Intrasporangium flavum]
MTVYGTPIEPRPDVDPTRDRVGEPVLEPADEQERQEADLRVRALQRLRKKADFRVHLLIYCLVNGMIVIVWAMTTSGFFWPIFPIAGWGIGLVANAYEAYVKEEPTEAQVAAEVERLRRR